MLSTIYENGILGVTVFYFYDDYITVIKVTNTNKTDKLRNVKVIYDGSKVAIQTKKTKKRKLDKTYIGENGVEIVSFGA